MKEKKVSKRYRLIYKLNNSSVAIMLDNIETNFTLAEIDAYTTKFESEKDLLQKLGLPLNGKIEITYKSRGNIATLTPIYKNFSYLRRLSSNVDEIEDYTLRFLKHAENQDLIYYLQTHGFINQRIIDALYSYMDIKEKGENAGFWYEKLKQAWGRYKVIRGIELGIDEYYKSKGMKQTDNIYMLAYTANNKIEIIDLRKILNIEALEFTLRQIDAFTSNYESEESLIYFLNQRYSPSITLNGHIIITSKKTANLPKIAYKSEDIKNLLMIDINEDFIRSEARILLLKTEDIKLWNFLVKNDYISKQIAKCRSIYFSGNDANKAKAFSDLCKLLDYEAIRNIHMGIEAYERELEKKEKKENSNQLVLF